jgi:glycosyltransferase involved in cell wall biosynthesis
MHVGLNALHLVPGETGGSEVYARRLVPALVAAEPGLRLSLFVGREGAALQWPDGVAVKSLPFSARSRPRRVLAEQTLLPVAAGRAGVELLHNLFTTAPAIAPVPQVTTIHDVIYERYPEAHAGLLSYGMRMLVPLAARRSRRVIAVSQATKEDVVRFLGIAPERIDVTYEGPGLTVPESPTPAAELRERLELGSTQLVLTVSAKRPHKNLERLFEAFAHIEEPATLLVPGYATAFENELRDRAAATASGRIRFAGWLSDADLDGLYRAATALVFPSLAEGFGLPVLEAMVRGTPVACSNTTSLPEIAGEAALLFDPLDVEAITDAIRRLLGDADLRRRLSDAGREQAARFTWEEAAQKTIDSYRRTLA